MERIEYGDVDLNLLIVLERLLHHRSVTLAAHDLGLSQPATSRALQRLRDELEDPILVRVGREMIATDRASALLQPVQEALHAAHAVLRRPPTFDPATAVGHVTVALGDEAQAAFGHLLLAALRREAPGLDLRVRALSTLTVEHGRRGLIDLALSPDLSALPEIAGRPDLSEFVVQPVYPRRFGLIASAAHWSEAPDLATYLRADHAIVSFEGGGRGFIDDLLRVDGHERRVAASVTSFTALARLVATTDLLAILPTEVVPSVSAGLVVFPPPLPLPTMDMQLVWHPRTRADPRHRFLRELFVRVVREAVGASS